MFQFPGYASTVAMYSLQSDCLLQQPGFPIRTSPDRSLLTAPRGIFVVRHVLHRLLAPRHPPCALISLSIVAIAGHFRLASKAFVRTAFVLDSFRYPVFKEQLSFVVAQKRHLLYYHIRFALFKR